MLAFSRDESRERASHSYDYTFEDCDKFLYMYPYLLPKLEGEWNIAVLCASLDDFEQLKRLELPLWMQVHVYLEKSLYDVYVNSHPNEVVRELTAKEQCVEIIHNFPLLVNPDAEKELIRRVRARPDVLISMLAELQLKSDVITLELVKKVVPKDDTVYASSVCYYFLTGVKYRWNYLEKLIALLGNDYAFYAMRKHLQRLMKAKHAYLHNEAEKPGIDRIPAPQLSNLYTRFMLAKSPKMLVPILASYDMKGDLFL